MNADDSRSAAQPISAGHDCPDPAGARLGPILVDDRSSEQRLHDAFEHAGQLLLGAGELPTTAGVASTLIVTMTLTDLEARVGAATTHHGGALSITEALRIAAHAQLIPTVLSDTGAVLHHGRGKRLATHHQRLALFARDRGCTFPGCAQPAARSEIHHTTDWANGGTTNLDTMTITCGYHNNEAPRQGWKTLLINNTPHWQPPAWQDPNQTPLRNYVHFPELLMTQTQSPDGESPDGESPDGEPPDGEPPDAER